MIVPPFWLFDEVSFALRGASFATGVIAGCLFILDPRRFRDGGSWVYLLKQCVYVEDGAFAPIGFQPCGERCSAHLTSHCERLGYTFLEDPPLQTRNQRTLSFTF
jgi:hypothetical protein